MMTNKDVVFRLIPIGEEVDPNSFCHYGWEGTGEFAFWKYAMAYYDSAEVLFEKFVASPGQYDILDGVGLTMCFLYRHFVELSIKSLFVKFVRNSEEDFKAFLKKGHRLTELWSATKPKLIDLKKRVGSSVDLDVLEHYILEFDRFDNDSMAMRYPVRKDLAAMHQSSRLDIINLHHRVGELRQAFDGLSYDLENQMEAKMEPERIDGFMKIYEAIRPKVLSLLEELRSSEKDVSNGKVWLSLSDIEYAEPGSDKLTRLLRSCTDDELIMLDTLYYTGRAIVSGGLTLPTDPQEARIDAVKLCILNMERDGLEFGKPKNDQINIFEKSESAIIRYIGTAVKVIDWDRQ